MGVIIPQVVTEDRAGGAQIIDGSLKFDKSKKNYLSRTPSAGNRAVWTWSAWIKRSGSISSSTNQRVFSARASDGSVTQGFLLLQTNDTLLFSDAGNSASLTTTNVLRDTGWFNIIVVCDTSLSSDRLKIYMNGVQLPLTGSQPTLNSTAGNFNNNIFHSISYDFYTGGNGEHCDFYLSQVYFIDGQALTPSSFGYTDPLTNTWRPKKLSSSIAFGTNGFYLPLDGNTPIGQDMSGKGNNWTPVNFGGSNTIEKATGALPILNTDGGGKVARVGVRTDSNASSLVLALPLVGIKSDFSNAINSGTSNKVISINGSAAASSTQNNFYGGSFTFNGSTDYLTVNYNSDLDFTGQFTLEGWVYPSASTGDHSVFGNFLANANGNWGLAFDYSTYGVFTVFYYQGNTSISNTGYVPTTGRWNHYAVTRDASNVIRVFLNGQLLPTTATYSGTLGVSNQNTFIAYRGGLNPLNGFIQDVRFYKGTAKYTQNFIPASTDPDILPDTPSGVAYSSNVALVPSTDGAVAFDGSGDYLSLGSSADFAFGTGDFTIEFFANKQKAGTAYEGVMGTASDGNGAGGFILELSSTRGFFLFFQEDGTGPSRFPISFSTNPNDGSWHHWAVTRSGSTYYMFKDGVMVASSTSSNYNIVCSNPLYIGRYVDIDFLGVLSNVHIVKGTALYTSNFTPPTAPITSVANTKLLCCKSQTSATAFDVSPGSITANGNAAATNFNPFTVNINTQRGQESGYCTWNPLTGAITLTNGNLAGNSTGGAWRGATGTTGVLNGKWYWESTIQNTDSGNYYGEFGFIKITDITGAITFPSGMNGIVYYARNGRKISGGTSVVTSSSGATTGDIVQVAVDLDAGKIWFGVNNIWIDSGNPASGTDAAYTGLSGTYLPVLGVYDGGTCNTTFGQKPFKFPPPAGFQPLALANTPRPTIVRPDQYVGIVTYTGTGATRSLTTGFKPDFLWIKERGASGGPVIVDSVRGASATLQTHATTQEQADSDAVTGFNPYGFSLGSGYTVVSVNGSTRTYVGWAWKAGGSGGGYSFWKDDIGYSTASAAGLTAGTITPSGASVNTKSGFSIITWTGNQAVATIPHGLGKKPSLVIVKGRNATTDWMVIHPGTTATKYIYLNTADASVTYSGFWNNTEPTDTVFTTGNDGIFTTSGRTFVAYLWAEIPGFSKFGTYTGNGSTDGPMVVTGFKPKWLLIKSSSAAGESWILEDTIRDTYNPASKWVYTNYSDAESNGLTIDFLSNGFKPRISGTSVNTSSATYIYAAFAESPSFNLYGGQSNAR